MRPRMDLQQVLFVMASVLPACVLEEIFTPKLVVELCSRETFEEVLRRLPTLSCLRYGRIKKFRQCVVRRRLFEGESGTSALMMLDETCDEATYNMVIEALPDGLQVELDLADKVLSQMVQLGFKPRFELFEAAFLPYFDQLARLCCRPREEMLLSFFDRMMPIINCGVRPGVYEAAIKMSRSDNERACSIIREALKHKVKLDKKRIRDVAFRLAAKEAVTLLKEVDDDVDEATAYYIGSYSESSLLEKMVVEAEEEVFSKSFTALVRLLLYKGEDPPCSMGCIPVLGAFCRIPNPCNLSRIAVAYAALEAGDPWIASKIVESCKVDEIGTYTQGLEAREASRVKRWLEYLVRCTC